MGGVGGHAEADDLAIDGGVAGERGVESLDGEHGGALAEGHAVAVCGEGAAAGGGDDADAVPGAQEAPGERSLVAAGDGGGDHAAADHLEGEADGVGGRGAGGGEGEDGAGDAEIDGDVAGAGAGHGAGDGEGMDARVVAVELCGLGLLGGAAAGGAAEDDGDVLRGVVLQEGGLAGGLTRGDDGVLRGAIGRGDDAGGEVLVGIESGDGGHLGEAEAIALFACLGERTEGGDAAETGEEGLFKSRDGQPDWRDATESSNNDALQRIQTPGRRKMGAVSEWVKRVQAERCRADG